MTELKTLNDLGSNAELDAALNGTGFVVCEFPPDEDPCECCGKTNVQHYWRQSDPFTQDGRYHCAECVIAEHEANQETDAFDYKHEASNDAGELQLGALRRMSIAESCQL